MKKSLTRPRGNRARRDGGIDNGAESVFNVHAAKTHLSRLLARVERGERIIIARAGKPVAVVSPSAVKDTPQLSPDDPLHNLDEFGFDGPGGDLTNRDIDHIVYGA